MTRRDFGYLLLTLALAPVTFLAGVRAWGALFDSGPWRALERAALRALLGP